MRKVNVDNNPSFTRLGALHLTPSYEILSLAHDSFYQVPERLTQIDTQFPAEPSASSTVHSQKQKVYILHTSRSASTYTDSCQDCAA